MKQAKTKLNLPKVIKGIGANRQIENFPLEHYSYSSLVRFCTNPILFKINYINGDKVETTRGISSVMGSAFHQALFAYYSEIDVINGNDPVKQGLEEGLKYLEEYSDSWIEYNEKIPNKQTALEKVAFAYACYMKESHYDPRKRKVVSLEELLEEAVDIEWRGQKLVLPVNLKGYLDKLEEDVEKGLIITDYKLTYAFTNPDKIDGGKIIQAIQYYFLVFAAYGKAPYSIIFEETKYTKSTKGGKQVQRYEMVYEKCEQFFDFYLRLYDDVTRAIAGEAVWVPNVNALYENEIALVAYIHRLDEAEEVASQMKKEKVRTITELLRKKIVNAGSLKKFMETANKQFVSAKSLNYNAMTIPEKIKTKFIEFGMLIDFHEVITGNTVDLYCFNPSIRLKMSNIKSYVADIEQVIGVSGVRILAPIPNTSLIGFEVPRKERTYPELIPKSNKFIEVAIGEDVMKKTYWFDIRKAPHILIAGATGSGKSVFLNVLIEQIKGKAELHLFDPKMVELSPYKGIAEQYYSDPLEIHKALEELVKEMNRRYERVSEMGLRNIDDTGIPYKVVVIDEFGDLIVSKHEIKKTIYSEEVYLSGPRKGEPKSRVETTNISKEIEKNILLLAQKARAAGIHVIIATQRPSTDIITGSIKANFPTKVAFRTAKEVDSRILIDEAGAEKLLGKGDMIFSSDEGTIRLQGYNK